MDTDSPCDAGDLPAKSRIFFRCRRYYHAMMNRRPFARAALAAPFLSLLTRPQSLGQTQTKSNSEGPGFNPPGQSFLSLIPHLLDVSTVPGIAIGVVQAGKTKWTHYRGAADLASARPFAQDSVFSAASLGKTPFAYAVLQLADQGKIDLDKPVRDYLSEDPPVGEYGSRVTARHILSHTSGFPNWRQSQTEPLTSSFEPGTKWQYSGEGYYALQRCVEEITGIGFEQFMQDRIFKPLEMTSSTYVWRDDFPSRIVTGYDWNQKPHQRWDFAMELHEKIKQSGKPLAEWRHKQVVEAMTKKTAPIANWIFPNAAYSLLTTVNDYSAFAARLAAPHGNSFDLSEETRAVMLNPYVRINSALSWGVGIGVERDVHARYNFQWGDNSFWKNIVMIHAPTRSAVVVATNGESGFRVIERVAKAASGIDHDQFLKI
jgi:CubicO group peptidase (beta-lactamase class C family)